MTKVRLGPKPYLLPQPAVLVGTTVEGKANFMTAAWCGMANHTPPIVTVAVRPQRHTEAGIREHRAFSLNVPPTRLVKEVDYCGIASGKKADKSGLFNVLPGTVEGAPLVAECALNLECRLIETRELPTHFLHFGEIVEVHVDESCLEEGVPRTDLIDPLAYSILDGHYWGLGQKVAKAFSVGKPEKS